MQRPVKACICFLCVMWRWCDVFMWRALVEQTSQSALCAPSCLTSHVAMRFIDTQPSTTSSWTSMTRSVRISSTTTWSRSWVEPLGTAVHQRVVGNVVFTTRCYASALLAMSLCLSVSICVCVCLCLSQVGVLLKRQNVGSHKQHHTIPQGV